MSSYSWLRLLTVIVALVLVVLGVWRSNMVDVVAGAALVWVVKQ